MNQFLLHKTKSNDRTSELTIFYVHSLGGGAPSIFCGLMITHANMLRFETALAGGLGLSLILQLTSLCKQIN